METDKNATIEKLDIEKVFREKSKKLHRWIPRFIFSYIKKVIHQDDLNGILTENPNSYNVDFGNKCKQLFGVTSSSTGIDKLDKNKRYIFVANHPLGGLDGIIFMTEVARFFPEIKFPVNDILMKIGRFKDIFVPINKHGGQAKSAVAAIDNAFASNEQVLYFPAGLVSRKQKGVIKDLEWKPAFIKKAIQHKRDIVPVHISGNNSTFFYNLYLFRKAIGIKAKIEMLYLVDEMFKLKGTDIKLTFGSPISWQSLQNDKNTKSLAQKIRETVYSLPKLI